MKPLTHIMLSLFFILTLTATSAFALNQAAKDAFDYGEYEKTIELVTQEKNYKSDISNVMLIAFSNLQLYEFTKFKHYKNEYKLNYDLIVAKAGVDDLEKILFFVNSQDKPVVVKSSRKLTKTIFKNLYKVDDIPKLLPFTVSSDEEVKKYAFDAIHTILKPKRDIVNKGGTMRPKDIRYFSDKKLISALVENLGEPKAKKILEVIEEPALEHLMAEGGTAGSKISASINKKIQKRKKKYPSSNWYSATGKTL